MSNLTRFEHDGIELVIDPAGEVFYPGWRALARVCSIRLENPIFDTQVKRTIESYLSKGATVQTPFEAEIETPGGLQLLTLLPVRLVLKCFLARYHQNPTQQAFETLMIIYKHQGEDPSELITLHNFNKKSKSKLKSTEVERKIQLAYQSRYGGIIEYPTANGRIDLLTDTTIFEFKIFKDYKDCLGQLLAYDDCVPGLNLLAVLFGVPKALKFNGSECHRVRDLLKKYNITVEFLR